MQPVASPLTTTWARADPLMPARRDSHPPRPFGGLVLLGALGDYQDRLDTVATSGVLPKQRSRDRGRHLGPGYELESLPAVLGIVRRVIRGSSAQVLVWIPHPIDRLVVALEGDEARLVEDLAGERW
jgi:hypothetical protein